MIAPMAKVGMGTLLKRYWYALFALGSGAIVGLYIFTYLNGVVVQAPVVVAAQDMVAGTVIETGMVRVAWLPTASVHRLAVRDKDAVVGRVAEGAIVQGEQVLSARLHDGAGGVGMSGALGTAEVGMYLSIANDSYPDDFVRPGQEVALIFVSRTREREISFARLLLRGVRVVQTSTSKSVGAGNGRKGKLEGVTLALNIGEAERVAYALEHGRVHLVFGGQTPADVSRPVVSWETLFEPGGGFRGDAQ